MRWEVLPFVYRPITQIANSAPVSLTVASHGLLADQRFAIISAKGLTELNISAFVDKIDSWYKATIVDANTVEINTISSLDFKTHTASTGYIVYRTVPDLSVYSARLTVRDKVGGTLLYSMSTSNSKIELDTVTRQIKLIFSADDTTSFTWSYGEFDLELVHNTNSTVVHLGSGTIEIEPQIAEA